MRPGEIGPPSPQWPPQPPNTPHQPTAPETPIVPRDAVVHPLHGPQPDVSLAPPADTYIAPRQASAGSTEPPHPNPSESNESLASSGEGDASTSPQPQPRRIHPPAASSSAHTPGEHTSDESDSDAPGYRTEAHTPASDAGPEAGQEDDQDPTQIPPYEAIGSVGFEGSMVIGDDVTIVTNDGTTTGSGVFYYHEETQDSAADSENTPPTPTGYYWESPDSTYDGSLGGSPSGAVHEEMSPDDPWNMPPGGTAVGSEDPESMQAAPPPPPTSRPSSKYLIITHGDDPGPTVQHGATNYIRIRRENGRIVSHTTETSHDPNAPQGPTAQEEGYDEYVVRRTFGPDGEQVDGPDGTVTGKYAIHRYQGDLPKPPKPPEQERRKPWWRWRP